MYGAEGSVQPLQLSEIKAWLDLDGVSDPYERMSFVRMLRRMDLVELNYLSERRKQEQAKK